MQLQPLFPLSALTRKISNAGKYPDVKPWVKKAIAEEDKKPNNQLWKREPSSEDQLNERLRRIRFLRKYGKNYPPLNAIANRLELCERADRCCSGACPECGRLIQRWFVRRSKRLIRNHIQKADHELVAITIIPATPIIGPGNLHTLSLLNMQRRLKYALDKAGLDIVIGGIDFSFNEEQRDKYKPFWSAHFYFITSVATQKRVTKILKQYFGSDYRIPRPVKLSAFNNSRLRRSYAFKIHYIRRIGIKQKPKNCIRRKCRDTSRDKLRVVERLELFMYLDQTGFAERFIFRSVKPEIHSTGVRLMGSWKLTSESSYQA